MTFGNEMNFVKFMLNRKFDNTKKNTHTIALKRKDHHHHHIMLNLMLTDFKNVPHSS